MDDQTMRDIIQALPMLSSTIKAILTPFKAINSHRDRKHQHILEIRELIMEFMNSANLARKCASQNYTHDFLSYEYTDFPRCSDVWDSVKSKLELPVEVEHFIDQAYQAFKSEKHSKVEYEKFATIFDELVKHFKEEYRIE